MQAISFVPRQEIRLAISVGNRSSFPEGHLPVHIRLRQKSGMGVSRQVDSEQPNFADWPLSSEVEGNEQIQRRRVFEAKGGALLPECLGRELLPDIMLLLIS